MTALNSKLSNLKSYLCSLLNDSTELYTFDVQALHGILQLIDVVLLDKLSDCLLSKRGYIDGVTLHTRTIFRGYKNRTHLNKVCNMLEDIINSCEGI